LFQSRIEIAYAQAQRLRKIAEANLPVLKALVELLQAMLKTQVNQLSKELGNAFTKIGL
jgi:hypothetical protein